MLLDLEDYTNGQAYAIIVLDLIISLLSWLSLSLRSMICFSYLAQSSRASANFCAVCWSLEVSVSRIMRKNMGDATYLFSAVEYLADASVNCDRKVSAECS